MGRKTKGRSVAKKILSAVIVVGGLGFLALLAIPLLPMGSGSARYARKWSARLEQIETPAQAQELWEEVSVKETTNREWIVWVSANSHGNPWGGTVVARDSRGDTRVFYGHVCGSAHVRGETLAEISRNLMDLYEAQSEE